MSDQEQSVEDIVRAVDAADTHILHRNNYTALTYNRQVQCRICGSPSRGLPNAENVEEVVNTLLIRNKTVRSIMETIEPVVAEWPEEWRPTRNSIQNHKDRHFNFRLSAAREIMERHAREQMANFEEAKGTIITAAGVLELILESGTEAIMTGDVIPDVKETMAAAMKLEDFKQSGVVSNAELISELDNIIKAVQKHVSPEQMERIHQELSEEPEALPAPSDDVSEAIDAEVVE